MRVFHARLRLLLAYFRKRKTEKHVLSSKSVRGILQGVGRKMYVVHIYQNMKVPEESSTKNGNDKLSFLWDSVYL